MAGVFDSKGFTWWQRSAKGAIPRLGPSPSPATSAKTFTQMASRSAMPKWPPSTSSAIQSLATGTTPSVHRNHHRLDPIIPRRILTALGEDDNATLATALSHAARGGHDGRRGLDPRTTRSGVARGRAGTGCGPPPEATPADASNWPERAGFAPSLLNGPIKKTFCGATKVSHFAVTAAIYPRHEQFREKLKTRTRPQIRHERT